MAVPFDNHGWMLWYNKKISSRNAGLDRLIILPKNGTDLIPWAQKITTDVNGKHPTDEGFDKDNVQVWALRVHLAPLYRPVHPLAVWWWRARPR